MLVEMEENVKFEDMVITFVSGNQGKIDEANSVLSDSKVKIKYEKIDLPELQGDLEFICTTKCKYASEVLEGPVIVEDTSLCFNALNDLPGPYIKWFYEKLKSDGLYRLLSGFDDKSARAVCLLGFTEGPGKDIILSRGETKGYIVQPKGEEGFGWDACFLPEDSEKTYAEMTYDEKNLISHRRKALDKLNLYFKTKQDNNFKDTIFVA